VREGPYCPGETDFMQGVVFLQKNKNITA